MSYCIFHVCVCMYVCARVHAGMCRYMKSMYFIWSLSWTALVTLLDSTGHSLGQHWSLSWTALVTLLDSTGHSLGQYWSLSWTVLVTLLDSTGHSLGQHWSLSWTVLVTLLDSTGHSLGQHWSFCVCFSSGSCRAGCLRKNISGSQLRPRPC